MHNCTQKFSGFGYDMDGRGGKVNSVESITGIPATDVLLQHGSESQVTYLNLCSLNENDQLFQRTRYQVRCLLQNTVAYNLNQSSCGY